MTTRSKYGVTTRAGVVSTLEQQMRERGMSAKDARYFALRAAYPERVVDGQLCDSVKEAQRYRDLLLLQQGGKIHTLRYHVAYELHVRSSKLLALQVVGSYVADFVYWTAAGVCIVEDVKGGDEKGTRTPLYQWKRKHFEIEYGITITEV